MTDTVQVPREAIEILLDHYLHCYGGIHDQLALDVRAVLAAAPQATDPPEKPKFAAVVEAREIARESLGTLREAMRLRRERDGQTVPDPLADLVLRFSAALLAKLQDAERKYGHNDSWLEDDWAETLRLKLREHVEKGDPRDVAAYCAFAWHHGWSTAAPQATDPRDGSLVSALYDATAKREVERGRFVIDDPAPDATVKCNKCDGAGWLWSHELGLPRSDDTRYACDVCEGKGKLPAAPDATGEIIRRVDPETGLVDYVSAHDATEVICCEGCGSTETIGQIRARNPQALSCCPERKMLSAKQWSDRATDWKARCEAADAALQRIGMILGSSDEWTSQGNMIADVEDRVTAAQAENEKLRAALVALLDLDQRCGWFSKQADDARSLLAAISPPLSPEKP